VSEFTSPLPSKSDLSDFNNLRPNSGKPELVGGRERTVQASRNRFFRGFKTLQNLDAPLLCPYTSAVP
jgi:uncharacterized membrane protein